MLGQSLNAAWLLISSEEPDWQTWCWKTPHLKPSCGRHRCASSRSSLLPFLVSLARGTERAFTNMSKAPHSPLSSLSTSSWGWTRVIHQFRRKKLLLFRTYYFTVLIARQISQGDSQQYFCRLVGSPCTVCTGAQSSSLTPLLTHISICSFSYFSLYIFSMASPLASKEGFLPQVESTSSQQPGRPVLSFLTAKMHF